MIPKSIKKKTKPVISAKSSEKTLYIGNHRKVFTRERTTGGIPHDYSMVQNMSYAYNAKQCEEDKEIEEDPREFDDDEPRPPVIEESDCEDSLPTIGKNTIYKNSFENTKIKQYPNYNQVIPTELFRNFPRLIIRKPDEAPKKPIFITKTLSIPIQWVEETAYLVEFEKQGEKYRQRYELLSMPYVNRVIFQASIFKNRPYTVFFQYPSFIGKQRPLQNVITLSQSELGDSYLGFSISENTQVFKCVCNALKYAGFRIGKGKSWNILWTGPSRLEIVTPLYPLQKTNHFPGIFQIGRKDNLWRNINRLKRIYGREYAICPSTYVFPEDYSLFLKEKDLVEGQIWILKPQASSCGNGIRLLRPGVVPTLKKYVRVLIT